MVGEPIVCRQLYSVQHEALGSMSEHDAVGDVMMGVAESVGRAAGAVAGQVDAIRAEHPHPVEEAKEAVATGTAKVAAATKSAKARVKAAVKTAKRAVRRVQRRGTAVAR